MASAPLANEAHPLAQWLRRTADLLDRIYVRTYNAESGRWGNSSVADLDPQDAAVRIAHWLAEGHTPVAVLSQRQAHTQEEGELSE